LVRDRFGCELASLAKEPFKPEATYATQWVLDHHNVDVLTKRALHGNPGREGMSC
jgi:hypothetical protein